jgi:hypothetical protein
MNNFLKNILSIIQKPYFIIQSMIVFFGITVLFVHYYDPRQNLRWYDAMVYWLIYSGCMIIIQVTLFLNVRKQLTQEEKNKK